MNTLRIFHRVGRAPNPRSSLGALGTAVILTLGILTSASQARAQDSHPKLDPRLAARANLADPDAVASVIVTLRPGAGVPAEFAAYARTGPLTIINGQVVDAPFRVLHALEAHPDVVGIHDNRPVTLHNFRTGLTVGARAVERTWGLTGAGIGVAVIDSGVAADHDDFSRNGTSTCFTGNHRVTAFVDFVDAQTRPYDDNGHGTHVSGIIAGNGCDSDGRKSGVAPDATLISLKVLDAQGVGTIGRAIGAFDWVLANHAAYNIRVVNLSIGAGVYESYWTDPLTLAAKRLVDAGIVVVTAAGNLGQTSGGEPQYGGITAPGNAPWVLTIGASSTMGTPSRGDDTMAGYSSRGPTYLDWTAKPDLVAPGTGTESPIDRDGLLYTLKPQLLIRGTHDPGYLPYMSLSGTSMAAPVVAGTVALMVQANPRITPNGVKALLQYTAEWYPDYSPLTEGAGFLNTLGAVRLARFFATAQSGDSVPIQQMWSRHIIWGNHLLSGGVPLPGANAWARGVDWGAARTASGSTIVWGEACPALNCDDLGWGTPAAKDIVWGEAASVDMWGSGLGDEQIVWGDSGPDHTVWGSAAADTIVWGGDGKDFNIVWGEDCGGSDCDEVVWGSVDPNDGHIRGTAQPGFDIVWGEACGGSVRGAGAPGFSTCYDIVWGERDDANITWGSRVANPYVIWTGSGTGGSSSNGIAGLQTDPAGGLAAMPDDRLLAYVVQMETKSAR